MDRSDKSTDQLKEGFILALHARGNPGFYVARQRVPGGGWFLDTITTVTKRDPASQFIVTFKTKEIIGLRSFAAGGKLLQVAGLNHQSILRVRVVDLNLEAILNVFIHAICRLSLLWLSSLLRRIIQVLSARGLPFTVNHSNLVKLEGFCIDGKEGTTYLVYEYVVNGSLDTWLHSDTGAGVGDGRRMDWRSRLRIGLDVANGLQYIHEHTWPRVVHKDIKSSNVLLDASFHAKIANFGLARTGLNAVTTHIVGTQGYVAPEYLADGIVSIKMDVFAFGVVLLELVSGRPAFDERTGEALWSEAERLLFRRVTTNKAEAEALLLEWMDPALVQQSCPVESVMSVIQVARACLHRDPAKRPTMVEATYLLSKADEHFSDYSGDGLSVVGGGDVAAR